MRWKLIFAKFSTQNVIENILILKQVAFRRTLPSAFCNEVGHTKLDALWVGCHGNNDSEVVVASISFPWSIFLLSCSVEQLGILFSGGLEVIKISACLNRPERVHCAIMCMRMAIECVQWQERCKPLYACVFWRIDHCQGTCGQCNGVAMGVALLLVLCVQVNSTWGFRGAQDHSFSGYIYHNPAWSVA